MTAVYCGIDLHSNNSVVVVKDAQGKVLYRRRLENDLRKIEQALAPYRERLAGVVVESTFNWYWLVDGLAGAGYPVKLANTTAIQQYSGLKHTDDESDAEWLAEMLRLGILPTGYIYPVAERGVRDLLRKRGQLVRQCTQNLLSVQNIMRRSDGARLKGDVIKALSVEAVREIMPQPDVALAMGANVAVIQCLQEQINGLEKVVMGRVKLRQEFRLLKTTPGIGDILALTIMLEAGEIKRFPSVGDFASYCRCVDSKKLSNRKKKGKGNAKNGNRYLAWAFVEAANFAIRCSTPVQRFYQRKKARTNGVVAIKAVAHKLARAAYHILRDEVAFDVTKAFA
jgi:transposase